MSLGHHPKSGFCQAFRDRVQSMAVLRTAIDWTDLSSRSDAFRALLTGHQTGHYGGRNPRRICRYIVEKLSFGRILNWT